MFISYVDNRPILKFHSLEALIDTIENYYRDELEDKTVEIKDEEGNLILSLSPKKCKNINPNLYAREEGETSPSLTAYIDEFGYITGVL